MIWGLIGVVAVLSASLALWLATRSRRRPARSGAGSAGSSERLDPADTASIGATLESIGHAHADARNRRLTILVTQLIDRQVPARAVEVVPGQAEARVRFADGTTVRARGEERGDLGLLAGVMREVSVTPTACTCDDTGVHIIFDRAARQVIGPPRRLSIRVIGIDQPD